MLGSPVSVAMNFGTQTIQLHTLFQIFQLLLSNSMKEFKHPNANWFALVCECCIALLTIIILVICYGGDSFTCVHSSHTYAGPYSAQQESAQQESAQHMMP